jgi:hypothetical protein
MPEKSKKVCAMKFLRGLLIFENESFDNALYINDIKLCLIAILCLVMDKIQMRKIFSIGNAR